jgi:hypothetical protein
MKAAATASWAVGAAAVLLAGCASTKLDAQWSDPQLGGRPLLHGAKVLVACEAYEPVVKRLCEDDAASEIVARGGTAVPAPANATSTPGRPVSDADLLGAARAVGATAIWSTTVSSAQQAQSSGTGVSVGLGGGGGHVGGGIGISLPIGQGANSVGYSASTRLMDVGSGKLAWTAMASSPPSSEVPQQLNELSKTLFSAADKAGLF